MIPAPGAFAAGVAIFLIVLWDAFEPSFSRAASRESFASLAFFTAPPGPCGNS